MAQGFSQRVKEYRIKDNKPIGVIGFDSTIRNNAKTTPKARVSRPNNSVLGTKRFLWSILQKSQQTLAAETNDKYWSCLTFNISSGKPMSFPGKFDSKGGRICSWCTARADCKEQANRATQRAGGRHLHGWGRRVLWPPPGGFKPRGHQDDDPGWPRSASRKHHILQQQIGGDLPLRSFKYGWFIIGLSQPQEQLTAS